MIALLSMAVLAVVCTAKSAAADTLPASHDFDLSAQVAKQPVLLKEEMQHPYWGGPVQAFAFDDVHHDLFVVQNHNVYDTYTAHGVFQAYTDTLVINRIPTTGANAGQVIDSMTVPDAGHGSIGVVPVGSGSQIWLEGDPNGPADGPCAGQHVCDASNNTEIFGTEIDSFMYQPNAITTTTRPAGLVAHFAGSYHISVSSDPVHQRLAIRYWNASLESFRVAVYNWNDVHDPALLRVSIPQTSFAQGFALYGQYYYVLNGKCLPSDDGCTDSTQLIEMNLNSVGSSGQATVSQSAHTAALATTLKGLSGEPEGIATHADASGHIGLFFGFNSRLVADQNLPKVVSIVCKTGWLPHVVTPQPAGCPL
jgi:hypothetical protein